PRLRVRRDAQLLPLPHALSLRALASGDALPTRRRSSPATAGFPRMKAGDREAPVHRAVPAAPRDLPCLEDLPRRVDLLRQLCRSVLLFLGVPACPAARCRRASLAAPASPAVQPCRVDLRGLGGQDGLAVRDVLEDLAARALFAEQVRSPRHDSEWLLCFGFS